jgi:hypothetical protein
LKFINKYIEDILIFSGLAAIVAATFMLSIIAGVYCFGVALLVIGVLLAKYPGRSKT